MKILFVSALKSSILCAYHHRILNLEQHCRKLGAQTSLLFLGDLFFGSPVLIQPLNIPFVLRYLKGFDIVYAGGNGGAYFLAAAKPLIGRDTLIVYDMHSDALTESRLIRNGPFDFVGYFRAFEAVLTDYVASSTLEYFLATSHTLKQRLLERKRNIKTEEVEVIPNGVDLETFTPQRRNISDVHSDSFTVTYAGSFNRFEGVDSLVKAAEILNGEDINFKLIGFRKHDLNIKEKIRRRLGEKALLLDYLPRKELVAELEKSDVLIVPADETSRAQRENRPGGCSTKLGEFLAVAKPVIVTKRDSAHRAVEKFNCGFVCEATAKSIAQTIRKAKGTPREILLLKGRNGRQFAEAQLDQDLLCRKFIRFLNRVIEKRRLQSKVNKRQERSPDAHYLRVERT